MLWLAILPFFFLHKSRTRELEEFLAFKQYREAIIVINELISDNKSISLLNERAFCECQLENYVKCFVDINTVLNTNKDPIHIKRAYQIQSMMHIKLGNFNQARISAESAGDDNLMNQIKEIENQILSAEEYFSSKEYEKCSSTYKKIYQAVPINQTIIVNYLNSLFYSMNFTEYKEIYKQIHEIDDTLNSQYQIISFCDGNHNASIKSHVLSKIDLQCLNHNNFEEYMRIASENCPKDSKVFGDILLTKAELLYSENKLEEALEILNSIPQKFTEVIQMLAKIEYDLHMYDLSISHYKSINDTEGANKSSTSKQKSLIIDYYAFLGLNRDKTYSDKEIHRAYKKIVRIWHPDKFRMKAKKKEAEKIMRRINSAYDILSNPKLRSLYDSGKNPLNPEDDRPTEFNKYEEFFSNQDFEMPEDAPLKITLEL